MKAVILYKPNTEKETSVLEYVREFARVTGRPIELMDVDTVHGIEIAKLYDIMQFPAIVVFKDDGEYIRSWLERDSWPTISELSFYK
ncbi:hypothetical protein KA021_01915 [Candidatus Saccharibacteria bacterium]|jgi:hypothetical protein|nr:hypothetical protein [Candidatus Saccharibacteria bacterium]